MFPWGVAACRNFSPDSLKTFHHEFTTLNVLLPSFATVNLTGGPNTAINLTYRMAAEGIPLRFISTDVPLGGNKGSIWDHFASLTEIPQRLPNVEILSANDRSQSISIGENDVFFATAWWTAQLAAQAMQKTNTRKFLYLIQDFEPGFYRWSTEYALSLETYGMDFLAIINEKFLAEYLFEAKIGRFADPDFIDRCAVFEPAIDTRKFHPDVVSIGSRPSRFIFYARPNAARNLFELGIFALREAVSQGLFEDQDWELLAIGEAIPDIDLGKGQILRNVPWLDYDSYSELIRGTDIALTLMLSPHTSYPPLEVAACECVRSAGVEGDIVQPPLPEHEVVLVQRDRIERLDLPAEEPTGEGA